MQGPLQDKIAAVMAITGMTVKELAFELDVSKSNLYKWRVTSNPREHAIYSALVNKLDNIIANPSGYGLQNVVVTNKPADSLLVAIYLDGEDKPQSYIENKFIPGSVIAANGKTVLIAYRKDSVLLGDADGLITVTGEDMAPQFKPGSMIAIKKMAYRKIVTPGNYYYIIDKNDVSVLRKVTLKGNDLLLISEDMENYPPFTRAFDDIKAIFSITAVINKI